MSADLLREASTEMRRVAENATPGRWKLWGMSVMADQAGSSNVDDAVPVADTYYRDENDKPRTWDADQITGMQPAVALAVADLLDREVADQEKRRADLRSAFGEAGDDFMPPCDPLLVGVARAYLNTPNKENSR